MIVKTPINLLLDNLDWKERQGEPDDKSIPWATHEGILEIAGHKLRCYQLNTGIRVFAAEDIEAFFAETE